ncbi:DUF6079 family protein [Pacificimonas flava]|uniref:Exonuclease SbcC n=1 Tax=Pacificimonas flava TaxID=1234595 RepID=M2U1S7_9SPHN|nr:DUF6079 family protein [Pacificimonas flava]EMD81932.1 Exonuclease SbcC [Pacificimonas flava]MBB5281536.1 energy-coupling factor transporter ATP-binding protein EcfA2 [Pacificimonas flava]
MKYRELIEFEPIESVIQLLDANETDEAIKLVSSYVISDAMAARMADVIIPQLSFDPAVDHKGVLIVGNYGSGKSHLMSVLSALAESEEAVAHLRHQGVRDAAASVAGKFEVLRIEISSRMTLRNIIAKELEDFLQARGIDFTFPAEDEVTQNKKALTDMMDVFDSEFPGKGLLIVVDEMLDYLRSRKDTELVHDLSFLREIGEITKNTRFRFVGGVQEAIFDSARFASTADSLRRVKDRFSQVLIDRQDIGFVVSERLLRKDENQREQISKHLEPFAKFYGTMGDKLDQYVRLFPVHPDFLKVFEAIDFAENRNALSVLSEEIRKILDDDVPSDSAGLITYDSFWGTVRTNPVFRAQPGIRDVVRISELLQEKVESAFPKGKSYALPTAHRIIDGLAVQRLTTPEIGTEMGPTPAELRDQLALMNPLAAEFETDEPSADLLTFIDATINDIMKAVNGQFITRSASSDQVFLDVSKDVDYDAEIRKRGESLDDEDLDNAYFQAVAHLMERLDDTEHVPGHKIWQHDLEWVEHKATRSGYLFFGTPVDRPTAYPARDFYLYFVQPFDPPKFKDEEKADEVFLRLADKDSEIAEILRRFAASTALASINTGSAKGVYSAKAEEALKAMRKWLRDKQTSAISATYKGKARTLGELAKTFSVRDRAHLKGEDTVNFREFVNVTAGFLLAPHFEDEYPQYPVFGSIVTDTNRRGLCTTAIKSLAGPSRPKDAVMVLDALKLLDGDKLDPQQSPYAKKIMELLGGKDHNQVLNRNDVMEGTSMAEVFERETFALEPDLVAVVLGALVYTGDIVVAVSGRKIDSSNLFAETGSLVEDLANFKHIEAPKDVNVGVLRSVFELFGIAPGQAQAAAKGDEGAVRDLQAAVSAKIQNALRLSTGLESSLSFWDASVLSQEQIADARTKIEGVRKFAETLTSFDTPAKLRNLRLTTKDVDDQKEGFSSVQRTSQLVEQISSISQDAAYLAQAILVLDDGDPWVQKAQELRGEAMGKLSSTHDTKTLMNLRHRVVELKKDYVDHYLSLHAKARLGTNEAKQKGALITSDRLRQAEQLATIPIIPSNELDNFRDALGNLKSCEGLVRSELNSTARCPHCQFSPRNEQLSLTPAKSRLSELDERLDQILSSWVEQIRDELDGDGQEKLQLLGDDAKVAVDEFLSAKDLPSPVPDNMLQGLRDALSDLVKIEVTSADLRSALTAKGAPVSLGDMRQRFDEMLASLVKGKDVEKVRFVVLEEGE